VSLRVFDLIGPLHIVDVHADLVVEFGRQLRGVGGDVREHNSRPELPVLQQHHGLVDQSLLAGDRLQFVQVHTLQHKHTHAHIHWEVRSCDLQHHHNINHTVKLQQPNKQCLKN